MSTMANYVGQYYITYEDGKKFTFPKFKITNATDYIQLHNGDNLEGSLFSYYDGSTLHQMGQTVLDFPTTLYMIQSGVNNLGSSLSVNGTTAIFALTNGETVGRTSAFHFFVLCEDDNENLYLGKYAIRTTYSPDYYNYSVVNPQTKQAGYFIIDFTGDREISSFEQLTEEYSPQAFALFSGATPYIPDTDPYIPAGTSGGGGGTGDFDDTSDTIGLPSLPTLSGLNTGFFTAFIPSASQMQNVSNYLWNNLITDILDPNQTMGEKIDALKKVVANPYDAIMGCSIVPVTPPTAGSKELKMYGLVETGITLPYASTRWVTVDCGTLNIHEFWGGYLDYSPYTKTTSLYLPYIGTVSIDIDLIMNKSLQVVYYVDILSGICVAFVLVDGSVKFHYQGQCATQVPITNADYSSTISAGIGLIGNVSQVVGSAVTGGVGGGVAGAVAGAVGGAISQAPSVASNVMGAKPDIRSGGSIGSSAGILSVQKPYLIIERPKQSLPAYQNTFTGYPSNITASVGDLSGYTEFESINLDNLSLTASEKDELETLLKGGVYL